MAALRRAFVAAALGWAAALPLATVAVTHARGGSAAGSLEGGLALLVYGAGSLLCHQKPERSFHLWAAQMPVCARCAGIYLGAALAAVAAGTPWSRATALARSVTGARLALAVASLPTAATLVYEWTTAVMPSNAVRFAAGLPIGLAVAWLVVGVLQDTGRPARTPA